MRSIHYFPRYTQKENVVTNNTLLLLLRLMDHSKYRFEDFLNRLAGDADLQFSPSWLSIGQQLTTEESVLDGFIAQDSVRIVVETKLHPNFNDDQLRRHLSAFRKGEDHKLFVLLCPTFPAMDRLGTFMTAAAQMGVEVLPTSFETIIKAMRDVLSFRDDEMLELIRDFEDFCSTTGLLPNDRYFLFAPPCGPSIADNQNLRLYYCPAHRGGRQAKFLGVYANKEIKAVGEIKKVVACQIDLETQTVSTANGEHLTQEERDRILQAAKLAPTHGWDITQDHKFFLCDDWSTTSFRKATPNGIQGHRMFDLRNVLGIDVPKTADEIATALNGKTWT